jgi:hypothetical protein
MAGTIRPMSRWETDLRAAVRRARDAPGNRAVVGPVDGPGGPWVAFRADGDGLVFESDAGEPRVLTEDEAIDAAAAALAGWGLVETDPLTCFLEGVDRDPVDDDPYNFTKVTSRLRLARLLHRRLSLVYDAAAGEIALDVRFAGLRSADVDIEASKPVNAPQARVLGELGLTGGGTHWSGRIGAGDEELEAVVPTVWSRVRDVRFGRR